MRGLSGLARRAPDDEQRVDATITIVVTDRRILFVPGELSLDSPRAADCGAVTYDEIESVSELSEDGIRCLRVARPDGVEWLVPLPPAEDPALEATFRHLRWIGHVRSRVCAATAAVDEAVPEIRGATGDRKWDHGRSVYEETRSTLDRVLDAVYCTEPVDPSALAPDITDAERRLERATAELHAERASIHLSQVRDLVAIQDYGVARQALREARAETRRAREHALAVRRGDAFVFGEQRALDDRLDRLSWQLDMVAAEPLRQGHEAAIRGETASEPAERIEHYERALRRYGRLLALERDPPDRVFGGDADDVRQAVIETAETLCELHRTYARCLWNEGVSRPEADDEAALTLYSAACDHLARAQSLADSVDQPAARTIDAHRSTLETAIERLRETGERPTVDPEFERQTATAEANAAASPSDAETSSVTIPSVAPDGGEGDGDGEGGQVPTAQAIRSVDAWDRGVRAQDLHPLGRTDGGPDVGTTDID